MSKKNHKREIKMLKDHYGVLHEMKTVAKEIEWENGDASLIIDERTY